MISTLLVNILLVFLVSFCVGHVEASTKRTVNQYVAAQDQKNIDSKACEKSKSMSVEDRFSRNEPNHFYLDNFQGNSKAHEHIDAKISIAYLISNTIDNNCKGLNNAWELAFTYTGEFDFYIDSRESGPVVGRRYNPGVLFLWSLNNPKGFTELFATVEHESNGQATTNEATLRTLERSFQEEYGESSQEMARETVSVGWDFFSIGTAYQFDFRNRDKSTSNDCNENFSCWRAYFKARQIFGYYEDATDWLADNSSEGIKSFAGTEMIIENSWKSGDVILRQGVELALETGEVGSRFGKNITYDFTYFAQIRLFEINWPLAITYHYGYNEELYRYYKKSNFVMFGLHLRF